MKFRLLKFLASRGLVVLKLGYFRTISFFYCGSRPFLQSLGTWFLKKTKDSRRNTQLIQTSYAFFNDLIFVDNHKYSHLRQVWSLVSGTLDFVPVVPFEAHILWLKGIPKVQSWYFHSRICTRFWFLSEPSMWSTCIVLALFSFHEKDWLGEKNNLKTLQLRRLYRDSERHTNRDNLSLQVINLLSWVFRTKETKKETKQTRDKK